MARGGVKRWLHCRADVASLPGEQRDELAAWLAGRDLAAPDVLLVTRGADGSHQLHLPSAVAEVELAELPAWLRGPELQREPKQPPRKRAVKAL